MHHNILVEVILLLASAVIAVSLFRRLNLTPILAYLTMGVVVGPFGLGWVSNEADARFLAEFGVVFLLFTLGLEFSLPQLIAMKRMVVGLGGTQVLLSTIAVVLIGYAAGLDWHTSFVVGGVLAMSSTAIVIKQLAEQLELSSRHGRAAVGILLFQDLAVIVFLIAVSTMSHGDGHMADKMLEALALGVGVSLGLLAAGHWILRPLFHEIAAARSSELFTLSALLVALSAGLITESAGLSMALGAFLAGMMLGETEFRHQLEADIRPFRDVLLGLFFVTVGMRLDVFALPDIYQWVLLITASLVVLKTSLIFGLGKMFGLNNGSALRTGIVLAQGGEFGFALLSLAADGHLITGSTTQIILASVILSMALTPFLVRYNGAVAKRIFAHSYQGAREQQQEEISHASEELENHVIIDGFGRTGQNLAHLCEAENVDYIALDLDPMIVRCTHEAGYNIFFGDAVHRGILEAAGIKRARMLAITHNNDTSSIRTIREARELNPGLMIMVRTADDHNLDQLYEAGANHVIPEALESSLLFSTTLLRQLGVDDTELRHIKDSARENRYEDLRNYFHGLEAEELEAHSKSRRRLHSVVINQRDYAAGRMVKVFEQRLGEVTITAIRRRGIRGTQPTPDTVIRSGDTIILMGTPSALEHAESVLLKG